MDKILGPGFPHLPVVLDSLLPCLLILPACHGPALAALQ